jgi:hypothetical protein
MHTPEDVFLSEHLGCLLRVVPVREGHVLQMDWDTPPTDKLYKQVRPQHARANMCGFVLCVCVCFVCVCWGQVTVMWLSRGHQSHHIHTDARPAAPGPVCFSAPSICCQSLLTPTFVPQRLPCTNFSHRILFTKPKAPSNYLSHLLGHEGDGSAFALLKARGLASSLSAGESGNSISSR